MRYNPEALSSYLSFRYLVSPQMRWRDDLEPPDWPAADVGEQFPVSTPGEVMDVLERVVDADETTGLLLSGGIDSAILASYLPPGAPAYTIRFVAPGAVDETEVAAQYAERFDLDWSVVDVTWRDYERHADDVMREKRSPMHAVEVALYEAANQARARGVTRLIVGNGADSTFGGMDKLLSRDWTFEEFVERYRFVDPVDVLKEPRSLSRFWVPWREGDGVDVQGFLKRVHGYGIIQTFEAGIGAAGCQVVAPYETMRIEAELDVERIRGGDTKYILRDVFRERVPGVEVPDKIAFARPMDVWLADWQGPERREFRADLDVAALSGEQRWLVWCLEQFLEWLDREVRS